MMLIRWWVLSLILVLSLTSCGEHSTARLDNTVANPLIGTWQRTDYPTITGHWIVTPTFLLYQEQPDGRYVKHSIAVMGSQLVIRSGLTQGTYGFTHDANHLILIQAETNQTLSFKRVSNRSTPPSDHAPSQ